MTETPATGSATPVVLSLRQSRGRSAAGGASGGATQFALASGALHVIAGDAGSGKTALVEMIAMAHAPGRAALELFGEDVASVRPAERHRLRRRIGMIFQDLRLIDDLTAAENLALAVRAAGRRASEAATNIAETLGWVGLGRHAATAAGALSADGRRRLALARAVINRPGLIIADDAIGRPDGVMDRLLDDLRAAGAAVLATTCDGDFAERSGGGVTWMSSRTARRPAGRDAVEGAA